MLAHFSHHLLTALPQPLLPLIRTEFNLNYTQSAMVQSSFSWTYGIAQIPAGWLADRIGPRVLLITGICGVALAGILVGLSQTYVMLIVFMVVMGIMGGGYHPSAAPMVSAAVPPENRGRALGFHEIGASGSFLVAPLIAASIASVWDWRISFLALAIPTFVFGLVFIKYIHRTEVRTGAGANVPESYARPIVAAGRWRRMIAFLVLSVITGGIVNSVFAFITLYAVDKYNASTTGAASFLVILSSAGLWVSPLGGYLSDRLGRVPLIITSCFLSASVVYMLNWAPYWWGIAGLMLLLGISTFTRMPVSEAYIMGETTEKHRSTIYGIYYFAMTETGAIFAPLMGLVIDRYGFNNSFNWASLAIVAVTLVSLMFLRGGKN